jgi:putative intracellular protease/amidase
MNIVFLLFDRITALDAVGPYEVLARLPGAHVTFAAPQAGEIRTDNRALGLIADVGIDDVQGCDLLLVPGGFGTRMLERDERLLEWLRAIDRTTQVTAAVCTARSCWRRRACWKAAGPTPTGLTATA